MNLAARSKSVFKQYWGILVNNKGNLRHEISTLQLFTFAFGTMVGAGWVILVGGLLNTSGSIGALIGLFIGAALMMTIAFAYAEIMAMYPVSGGEFAYAYLCFGKHAAFLVGWILAFAYIAVTAFEIISIGWLLGEILPVLQGPRIYSILGGEVRLGHLLSGVICMGLITAANLAGAKVAARVQDSLVYLMLGITIIFGISGIAAGDLQNLKPYWFGGTSPDIWGSIIAVVAVTPFWFAGFDVLPQAMGEKSDNVIVGRIIYVMIASIVVAYLFYFLVVMATSMSQPRDILLQSDLTVVSAIEASLGSPWMAKLVIIAAILGLLSTWNAIFFAAARLTYVLGKARLLPKSFGSINTRTGTPTAAILFSAITAMILALLGKGGIGPIVGSVGGCLAFVFMITSLGVLRLRLSFPNQIRPYKAPILTLWLAIVSSTFILYHALREDLDKPRIMGIPPGLFILALWLALGVIYWQANRKNRQSIDECSRRDLILIADS